MRTVVIVILLLVLGWAYYTWQTTGRLPFVEEKSTLTGDTRLDKWIIELEDVKREIDQLEETAAAETAREGYVHERYHERLNRRDELRRMIKLRREKLGLPEE